MVGRDQNAHALSTTDWVDNATAPYDVNQTTTTASWRCCWTYSQGTVRTLLVHDIETTMMSGSADGQGGDRTNARDELAWDPPPRRPAWRILTA